MFRRRFLSSMILVSAAMLAACHAPAVAPVEHERPVNAFAALVQARAIIIVRHGDIDIAAKARQGNATPLLPRGEARAKELAFALKDAGITRIITSSSLRTQETAAPLAAALHIKPELAVGHGPESGRSALSPEAEARGMMDYLQHESHPEDVVLVVYHHSVIPSLLKDFGYEEPPIEDATEFDRLYVILPDPQSGHYRVFRLRYGGKWGE